uniref:C2H2-type domain-containing protein n=1 Tax=Steinernema glaseri TaxID=37863 RepID=A0A1I7YAT8_9BILA
MPLAPTTVTSFLDTVLTKLTMMPIVTHRRPRHKKKMLNTQGIFDMKLCPSCTSLYTETYQMEVNCDGRRLLRSKNVQSSSSFFRQLPDCYSGA